MKLTWIACHAFITFFIIHSMVAAQDSAHTNATTDLLKAASSGEVAKVGPLLTQGVDPNVADRGGTNALMISSQKGHLPVVQLLLDHGADINAANNRGITALMTASYQGNFEIVDVLLKSGADPNMVSVGGGAALTVAATHGHKGIVELLLGYSADINHQQENGITALMGAAMKGHREVVEILIEAGAAVNLTEADGRTAGELARQNRHVEITLLIERTVYQRLQDSFNRGLTMFLTMSNNPDMAKNRTVIPWNELAGGCWFDSGRCVRIGETEYPFCLKTSDIYADRGNMVDTVAYVKSLYSMTSEDSAKWTVNTPYLFGTPPDTTLVGPDGHNYVFSTAVFLIAGGVEIDKSGFLVFDEAGVPWSLVRDGEDIGVAIFVDCVYYTIEHSVYLREGSYIFSANSIDICGHSMAGRIGVAKEGIVLERP